MELYENRILNLTLQDKEIDDFKLLIVELFELTNQVGFMKLQLSDNSEQTLFGIIAKLSSDKHSINKL